MGFTAVSLPCLFAVIGSMGCIALRNAKSECASLREETFCGDPLLMSPQELELEGRHLARSPVVSWASDFLTGVACSQGEAPLSAL